MSKWYWVYNTDGEWLAWEGQGQRQGQSREWHLIVKSINISIDLLFTQKLLVYT